MNIDKELIKIMKLPKQFTVNELSMQILGIMKMTARERGDLAGVLLDAHEKASTGYLFFRKLGNIERMKMICHSREGKRMIFLKNGEFEIRFCGQNERFILANVENSHGGKEEIKVRVHKKEGIEDVMKKLPETITTHLINPKLLSIVLNRNSAFLKFQSDEEASIATECLIGLGHDVVFSKTYTFVDTTEESQSSQAIYSEQQGLTQRQTHPRVEPPVQDSSRAVKEWSVKDDVLSIEEGNDPCTTISISGSSSESTSSESSESETERKRRKVAWRDKEVNLEAEAIRFNQSREIAVKKFQEVLDSPFCEEPKRLLMNRVARGDTRYKLTLVPERDELTSPGMINLCDLEFE
jgi:hypothetical protein